MKSDRYIRQKTLKEKVGYFKLFKHIYPLQFSTSYMKQDIVLESLRQAIYKTKNTKGIIVQSGLGSQYLSCDVYQFLQPNEILHSYSRKKVPQENAPIEAFHSISSEKN